MGFLYKMILIFNFQISDFPPYIPESPMSFLFFSLTQKKKHAFAYHIVDEVACQVDTLGVG